MSELRLPRGDVPYRVRRSARAKRLRITVRPGGIEVVAPVRTRAGDIRTFVELHRPWIEDKVEAVRRALAAHPGPSRLTHGVRIPYLGHLVPLAVSPAPAARPEVAYRDGFHVRLPRGALEQEASIEDALTAWLKRQARIEAEALVQRHGPRHGLEPSRIVIKEQKRLWGSCTAKGVINLNWRLIFAPVAVFEYVVVHELCHLRVRNHQSEFWQLVGDVLPGYARQRAWLRQRGHLLSLKPGAL